MKQDRIILGCVIPHPGCLCGKFTQPRRSLFVGLCIIQKCILDDDIDITYVSFMFKG